jgi:ATP-binding cassette subfamily B protein
LLIGLALIPLALAFELAQPYMLKIAIEDYIGKNDLSGLDTLAVIYVGLVLAQTTISYAQIYALQLLGQRSMHDLRLETYRHVLSQRSAFFDRVPVGRLMTRMTNDVEAINEMFASGVITIIADIVKLVAIVVIMLSLNAKLALMTFVTLPLLVVLVNFARGIMRKSFREVRVKLAAMNSYVSEHLSGIKVVQLFRREQQSSREYDELSASYRDAYFQTIRADAAMYAFVEAISVMSIACIVWYAGGNLSDGLTVGLVVAFIEYVNKFFIPVRDLSAKYAVMQSAMAATERIMALLDTHEPDAPVRQSAREAEAIEGGSPQVEFDAVSFGYRGRDLVLRDVSLVVPPGKTVAVVGATGSGKSTLIRLLVRLYAYEQGTILVGDHDVRDIDAAELRRRIAVVSQDVFMFAGTVRENIRLGNPDATDALIDDALHRVGGDRMLARRGSDLDEMVDERGANFSAGERQLIAFARALVRDPQILVLDEATAHVDPEAEAWIEQGVAELMQGRTTLVIAHRLSTVRNADQILVMARGEIVERGTHAELVEMGGAYARLERTFSRRD